MEITCFFQPYDWKWFLMLIHSAIFLVVSSFLFYKASVKKWFEIITSNVWLVVKYKEPFLLKRNKALKEWDEKDLIHRFEAILLLRKIFDILIFSIFSQMKIVRCVLHFVLSLFYLVIMAILQPYDTQYHVIEYCKCCYCKCCSGNKGHSKGLDFNSFEIYFGSLEVLLNGLNLWVYIQETNLPPFAVSLTTIVLWTMGLTNMVLLLLLLKIYGSRFCESVDLKFKAKVREASAKK